MELIPLTSRTRLAYYFAIFCGLWFSFKYIEPWVFPVVTDFKVTAQLEYPKSLVITGNFNKQRGCEYVQVIAYAGEQLIDIEFLGTKGKTYNRRVGKQHFGPWRLTPKGSEITLYSTHECLTGEVVTELGSVIFPLLP